jgi:hypothetical protein
VKELSGQICFHCQWADISTVLLLFLSKTLKMKITKEHVRRPVVEPSVHSLELLHCESYACPKSVILCMSAAIKRHLKPDLAIIPVLPWFPALDHFARFDH